MVKCDEECLVFKYYNENNKHEFIDNLSYGKTAQIICDLILCPEFQCDSTITSALYVAMRKMELLR